MHVSIRKMSWIAAALVISLTACNMTGDVRPTPAQNGNDSPSGDLPRALVLGEAEGTVLDELDGEVEMTPYDGSQNGADYELVIFDGDTHSADTIRDHEVINQALRAHRWVLGVDVTSDHKQDALGPYLHFATKDLSYGYFVRITEEPNGFAGTQVIEYPREVTLFGDIASSMSSQTVDAQTGMTGGAATFVHRVMGELTGKSLTAQQVGDAPPTIPNGVIYYPFYYRQVVPWQAGGAQKANKESTQKIYYDLAYSFDVFLDNKANSRGDFQWVSVRIDGEANPTTSTGNFVNMAKDEKAWWQDRLKFQIKPGDAHNALFSSYGSSPETFNEKSTVTSGVDFTIGVDHSGPNADFGYHYEQEREITDWKITNNSSAGLMAWDYRSSKIDADKDYACGTAANNWLYNGFDAGSCYPLEPSELSKNTLSVHAQGVWKTDKVLTEWVDFEAESEQHVADTYCASDMGLYCVRHSLAESKRGYAAIPATFSINMGAVVPIPIKSVTFSPDPAVGGEQVTGTITLEAPAQSNTTVLLASNSTNASVKPTVTIPQGQASATFQVLTSTNGIAAGDSTIATITAYYGDDFQAQLAIANTPFLDLAFSDTQVIIAQNPTRTGSVAISKIAPAGGVKVNLSLYDVDGGLTNGSATFPESVTIPQGKTSVPIKITFTNGGPPDNAFGFFLRADGGNWGQDEVKFVVSKE